MAADAEECCLEGSAQVTDYILESCLHSAVQDLKAVLAQSRRVNFNDTVSFSSWQHCSKFHHCITSFYFLNPEALSPHSHLSMLQRSLALFLWEFEEFTPFHSFSVFLFLLLKLARYGEFRCHIFGVLAYFAAVPLESIRHRNEASLLFVLFHLTKNIPLSSFFFQFF